MFRKIVLLLGLLILLIVIYNLMSQILQTLKSGGRVTQATEKLHQLEQKNLQLKKRLAEVQTTDFVEQQARDKLGLVKEGETLIIIPDEKIDLILEASKSAEIVRLPNPLGWWRVFF